MLRIVIQLIPLAPFNTKENPTVAPTALCVVETGKWKTVATISQNAVPKKRTFLMICFKISLDSSLYGLIFIRAPG